MPSVSRRIDPQRPSALDVFTNREDLIQSFNHLLATKAPQDNNVLLFYGEGGIGKTTLSQKLQQELIDSAEGNRSARLDFAFPRNAEPDLALFRLKEAFCDLPFPTFLIGLAHYAGRFHPEVPFLSNRVAFVEGAGPYAELIDSAFDLGNSTPGLSLALNAIKGFTQGSQRLRTWFRKRAEACCGIWPLSQPRSCLPCCQCCGRRTSAMGWPPQAAPMTSTRRATGPCPAR